MSSLALGSGADEPVNVSHNSPRLHGSHHNFGTIGDSRRSSVSRDAAASPVPSPFSNRLLDGPRVFTDLIGNDQPRQQPGISQRPGLSRGSSVRAKSPLPMHQIVASEDSAGAVDFHRAKEGSDGEDEADAQSPNKAASPSAPGPGPGVIGSGLSANHGASATQGASPVATAPPIASMSGGGMPQMSEFDKQARQSPFVNDLLDRLIRVELGMKDMSRQLSTLNRNVSALLDRMQPGAAGKEATLSKAPGGPASSTYAPTLSGFSATGGSAAPAGMNALSANLANMGLSSVPGAAQPSGMTSSQPPQAEGDFRSLSQQLSSLSSSVAQLLSMQTGTQAASSAVQPGGQFGLGLAGSLAGPNLVHPNDASSPLLGGLSAFAAGGQSHLLSPNPERMSSPRPGAGPMRPSWSNTSHDSGHGGSRDRRYSTLPPQGRRESMPNTDDSRSYSMDSTPTATKWEQLSLPNDLLRAIQKYGLGPPNKIQQRALPFLLRGADIIAQAPPTQERIAAYVIPALNTVLTTLRDPAHMSSDRPLGRGPLVLVICTTVDQATQAQRMALGLGANLGVRVGTVAAVGVDTATEAQNVLQMAPHILVGTPQKMHDLFTYVTPRGGVPTNDIRLVILDEVDQLIARNMSDFVSSLLRLLPIPRAVPRTSSAAGTATPPVLSPGIPSSSAFAPFDPNAVSGYPNSGGRGPQAVLESDRQTAIFSNTVPQDVLNFASSINLREPVRVLVRREGANRGLDSASERPMSGSSTSSSIFGGGGGATTADALLRGLRHYYLYVAVGSAAAGMTSPGMGAAWGRMGMDSSIMHAKEMKLDVITDLLEDIEFGQAVIYTANAQTLEAVTYKLASKNMEALALHQDLPLTTRQTVLSKFRAPGSSLMLGGGMSRPAKKALVVCDLLVKPSDVHQVPLVVMYDMPRTVEEYVQKVACAASTGLARPGVCINVVTASGGNGGDVDMLRTIESHTRIKMTELPMDAKALVA